MRTAGQSWNLFPGTRARRVADLLATTSTPAPETAARWQHDVNASFYTYHRDLIRRYVPAGVAVLAPALAEIESWRGTAAVYERGLALLVAFHECLRDAVFAAATHTRRGTTTKAPATATRCAAGEVVV
ncbi:hypothetical protein F8274_00875 [Micromonospora sp. AMSO31t]|nr:hypothetical protein F8274_00875 [Micromonospora sp. AMSO31t]